MERSEILTEDWLLECWQKRNDQDFDALSIDFIRIYRAKPLHNLNLFFFGAADEIEQRHLHNLTTDNGRLNATFRFSFLIKEFSRFQAVSLRPNYPKRVTLFSAMEWTSTRFSRLIRRTNENIDNTS